MDDIQDILRRLATAELRLASFGKRGVVNQYKDGKALIDWGPKADGTASGLAASPTGSDGQSSTDPHLSPWITPATHNGFITEHTPFKVGQSVMSLGSDIDGLTHLLFPADPSNINPRDKNATDDGVTRRIRKPQSSSMGARFGSVDPGTGTPQAAHDDDEDVQFVNSYNAHKLAYGTKLSHAIDRQAGTHEVNAENSQVQLSKDKVGHKAATHDFADKDGGDSAKHSVSGDASVSKTHSTGGDASVGGNHSVAKDQNVSGNSNVGQSLGVGGAINALGGLMIPSGGGGGGQDDPPQMQDVNDAISNAKSQAVAQAKPKWGRRDETQPVADLFLSAKARGAVHVQTDDFTSTLFDFVADTATSTTAIVNRIQATGVAAGASPEIRVVGTDAVINLKLTPFGPKSTIVTSIPGSYTTDALAGAAGIPVGGLYHNSGAVRIRLV